MIHSISAEHAGYLAQCMDDVSRSFALVVRVLEEPLRYQLAAAYLLCRVADNIEDCGQPEPWQRKRFAEFHDLLIDPASAIHVLAEWEDLEWPGLTDGEKRMMGLPGGLPLWQIYEGIGDDGRHSIRTWVSTMATGMEQIEDDSKPPIVLDSEGVRCLADVPDYNEYCYYVAGTVGHMATELVAHYYGFPPDLHAELSELSEACGRSLQKTNIVKDFKDDLDRGVCYLPASWLDEVGYAPLRLEGAPTGWALMVIADVVKELRSATEYLVKLPLTASGYRMASLLCLLPAYATLSLAAKRQRSLFTHEHKVKISRTQMVKCQMQAQSMVSDNDGICAYAQRLEAEICTGFENS
ncbi:MAG: phytoene/squalene synthase family protein [Caldilineaceae bacterium]